MEDKFEDFRKELNSLLDTYVVNEIIASDEKDDLLHNLGELVFQIEYITTLSK